MYTISHHVSLRLPYDHTPVAMIGDYAIVYKTIGQKSPRSYNVYHVDADGICYSGVYDLTFPEAINNALSRAFPGAGYRLNGTR